MKILRYTAAFAASFMGGVVGFVPVYVMGLVVPIFVVGPLALLTGSLVATLLTSWVANLLAMDGSRSRLFVVFGISGVAAVAGLLLYFAGAWAVNTFDLGFGFGVDLLVYLPGAAVFSGMTTAAAWRLRSPGGRLGKCGVGALVLSVGVLVLSLLANPTVEVFPIYEVAVGANLAVVISCLIAMAWLGRRGSLGRGLARDAAITLCLSTSILPAVSGIVALACSATYCGA